MEPTTTPTPTVALDPKMARKLLRNLRILNTLVIFFALLIISTFVVTGVLAYKVLTEVRETKDSFNSLTEKAQDNLNFKSDLCSSSGSVSTLLKRQSSVCD